MTTEKMEMILMRYRTNGVGLLVLGLLLSIAGRSSAEETAPAEVKPVALGSKVANTRSLRDLRGTRRSLHGFKGYKAVVLAFTGTACPLANLYVPRLVGLEKKYRDKKVLFLAIYPNEHEDLDQVAGHAYDRDIPFSVLKDFGQRLADAVGVKRTPAVVVLDGDFKLRYRGRVDDQYAIGVRKPKPTCTYLSDALDEILAGKKVTVAETEADGCLLDRAATEPTLKNITYTRHVASILQQRCQSCHRPGQSGPFSLRTFDDARKRGRMIKEVTTQRRMPPWHADPRYGKFANSRRMTNDEIETIASWVDGGMKKGDPRELPKPVNWSRDWALGKPDLVIKMPEPYKVPAEGVVPYIRRTVQTNFKEDRWVQMAQALPGAAPVVHHIVVYILAPGQKRPFRPDGGMSVLVGWAPGDLPMICPPGTALRIPKGARLVFEMHYTPIGTPMTDQSRIGITWAKKPPEREVFINTFANESIRVPARDPHYKAEASFRLRADARLISFVPHMHWRGKHYHYEAIFPDGTKKTLLSVPRWDFNWQSVYVFKKPIFLPRGTRLHAVAHWDNSKNNPYNPDPSKSVNFGLQTWDEMMVGWATYVWDKPGTATKLAKNPPHPAELMFNRFDHNGDNMVEKSEVHPRMLFWLQLVGVKVKDKMNRQEFRTFYEEMRKRFRRRPRKDDQSDQKQEKKADTPRERSEK